MTQSNKIIEEIIENTLSKFSWDEGEFIFKNKVIVVIREALTSLQKENDKLKEEHIIHISPNKFHSVLRELELEQQKNDELKKDISYWKRHYYLADKHKMQQVEIILRLQSQLLKAEKNIEFHKKRADSLSRFETERVKKIKQQTNKDKEDMFKEIEDRLTFINSAVNDARIYKDKVKTIEKQNVANECIFRLHEEEIFLEQLKQKHLKQKDD